MSPSKTNAVRPSIPVIRSHRTRAQRRPHPDEDAEVRGVLLDERTEAGALIRAMAYKFPKTDSMSLGCNICWSMNAETHGIRLEVVLGLVMHERMNFVRSLSCQPVVRVWMMSGEYPVSSLASEVPEGVRCGIEMNWTSFSLVSRDVS